MAEKEKNSVAWFCTYTPLEILDAAGLVPERRFGDPATLESADALLHPAICPYIRACLAAEMREDGPHHAIFVNSCDGMRRLYDAWASLYPDDFVYLMDLPRNDGPWGERLLVEEYRNLIRNLEDAWGSQVTTRALLEAGMKREERRLAYMRLAEGRSGVDRLRLAMDFQAMSGDAAATHAGAAGHENRGIPVTLTGNLLNPAGLVSNLDQAGARVAWIDLCNGDRGFSAPTLAQGKDLDVLLTSMARRYLDRHPCARMSDGGRRYDLLLEASRTVGSRGVIYASLKFCDAYLYDFPRVQQRLKAAGMPLLRLESDYTDGHVGQLLTRVEAFLEML